MVRPNVMDCNAELIFDSLLSHLTINQDVANSKIVGIVNTKIKKFLNTSHNNTLNPKIPSVVVSYIENL